MPYAGHVCCTFPQPFTLQEKFCRCEKHGTATACNCVSVLSTDMSCSSAFITCMLFVLQVMECRAKRCFYVAHAYLAAGKQLEAHALFGRAAQHAKLAAKQHQVCSLLHVQLSLAKVVRVECTTA